MKRHLIGCDSQSLMRVLLAAAFSLSLVLGGEGSSVEHVGWAYSPTISRSIGGRVRPPYMTAEEAQLDARPLTLTLSPEYEGEGTGGGDDGRVACRSTAEPRRVRTADLPSPHAGEMVRGADPTSLVAPAPSGAAPSLPAGAATRPANAATRPARELNLLAMGDWGEAKSAQKNVADAMADYVAAQKAPFAGFLSAGDNFYVPLASVDDPAWQTLFEKMYDARRLDFPFYGALGNHDYDQNKYLVELAYAKRHPDSRWKLPGRWYRIDLPTKQPLVTAIVLDSDRQELTAVEWALERKFLAEELAKPRADWTICVAHHPLFSNGVASDNGILQKDWGELFEKEHVDFYLCGHEHNLQHLEIAGWKESFVIAGGGGAHSHPLIRDNRGPFSRSVYGFVHFDLTPDLAAVRYIGTDGKTLHEFTRTKAGKVTITSTTPSDAAIDKPLEAIQGLYDKLHPPKSPATKPATGPAPVSR
ncbi:MAG: putative phosphohydrolase [Phycisphaerales bacterium]|nr:putative phosphohydrolase [Phycisphaerales bacterium]